MVAPTARSSGFLVSRYGQFVLLTPKASLGNAVLWVGPLLVVAAGAAVLLARRRGAPAPTNLTAEEEAELEKLSHVDSALMK